MKVMNVAKVPPLGLKQGKIVEKITLQCWSYLQDFGQMLQ